MPCYEQITLSSFAAFASRYSLVETPCSWAKELQFLRQVTTDVTVQVWSSLVPCEAGEAKARKCGADAMRVQLIGPDGSVLAWIGKANREGGWQPRLGKLVEKAVLAAPEAGRTYRSLLVARARQGSLECPSCKGPVKAVVGRKAGVCFVCNNRPRCEKGGWLPGTVATPVTATTFSGLIEASDRKTPGACQLGIDGETFVVSGSATFRCRRLLATFGLVFDKVSKSYRGGKRSLEERRAMVAEMEAAGISVSKS